MAVSGVEFQYPAAHRQVFVPTPQLDFCAGERVVSAHDRSVERGRQRGMHEVQQVRRGGRQALDSVPVECVDRLQHACLVVAALAFVQEARAEEHTSELQSLMRNSYAVLRWKK